MMRQIKLINSLINRSYACPQPAEIIYILIYIIWLDLSMCPSIVEYIPTSEEIEVIDISFNYSKENK